MSETVFLSVEHLLQLTDDLGAGPVRDVGLLASAAARPQTTVFGEDAYPTLELKPAALLHSICCNEALVDGNKRLAWLGATVFLDLDGVDVALTQDQGFRLVMGVAEGRLAVPDIAPLLAGPPAG